MSVSDSHHPIGEPMPLWHADFVARILPTVEKLAKQRFAKDSDKEEKIQAAFCLAWKAYKDLVETGREEKIYPSKLADYSCRQVKDGRQVGGNQSVRDVLSPKAQRSKEFVVTGFGNSYELPPEMNEALGEHDRSPVPDQVSFRCDFPAWLSNLSTRVRKIARWLSLGHSTKETAKRFGVTPARVSQLRRELAESWHEYLGEPIADA